MTDKESVIDFASYLTKRAFNMGASRHIYKRTTKREVDQLRILANRWYKSLNRRERGYIKNYIDSLNFYVKNFKVYSDKLIEDLENEEEQTISDAFSDKKVDELEKELLRLRANEGLDDLGDEIIENEEDEKTDKTLFDHIISFENLTIGNTEWILNFARMINKERFLFLDVLSDEDIVRVTKAFLSKRYNGDIKGKLKGDFEKIITRGKKTLELK